MKGKAIFEKIIKPPFWAIIALIILSTVLLVFGLKPENHGTALSYASYFVSSYTLAITVAALVKAVKSGFYNNKLIKKIDATRFGHLFLNDIAFRGTMSIYQGFTINLIYAVFRGITAAVYHSIWFGTIAIYYLFLSLIRLALLFGVSRLKKYPQGEGRTVFEYKICLFSGFLMLLLNTGMSGMTVLMVKENMHYEYPGYIIYFSALYTFIYAITAIINVVKFHRIKSPVLSASKAITFTGAAMSVLALQTAMIARFGSNDGSFRQIANSATGGVVCLISLAVAIALIAKSAVKLKKS